MVAKAQTAVFCFMAKTWTFRIPVRQDQPLKAILMLVLSVVGNMQPGEKIAVSAPDVFVHVPAPTLGTDLSEN
jgi:hypothetical protein